MDGIVAHEGEVFIGEDRPKPEFKRGVGIQPVVEGVFANRASELRPAGAKRQAMGNEIVNSVVDLYNAVDPVVQKHWLSLAGIWYFLGVIRRPLAYFLGRVTGVHWLSRQIFRLFDND
jgi:hypothetical protein